MARVRVAAARRRLSPGGLRAIARREGLRLHAYRDAAGVWTVGYGSTRGVRPGMSITEQDALRRLAEDVRDATRAVRRLVRVPVTQGEFDALASFTFNVGEGALADSTLLRLLNQGHRRAAAAQFARWTRAGGRVLPGLVARRAGEARRFLTR